MPDSINEVYVAYALETLEVPFEFQQPIGGGKVRGGQVADFIVMTPFPEAVQVMGRYWHGGQKTDLDRLKQIQIEQAGYLYHEWWDWETDTYEKCLAKVRELL
jgi:hypothetical protein